MGGDVRRLEFTGRDDASPQPPVRFEFANEGFAAAPDEQRDSVGIRAQNLTHGDPQERRDQRNRKAPKCPTIFVSGGRCRSRDLAPFACCFGGEPVHSRESEARSHPPANTAPCPEASDPTSGSR